jgi:hypothetical protein
VFILAFAIGGLAISDFAYNAYVRAESLAGNPPTEDYGDTFPSLTVTEEHQQLDAAAAMLAAAFLITSAVLSRRIKRHRR